MPQFLDPEPVCAADDGTLQLSSVLICSIQPKLASKAMQLLGTQLPIRHLQHLKRIRKPAGASTLDIIICDANLDTIPQPVQAFLDQHSLQLRTADVPLQPPPTQEQLAEWSAMWPTIWRIPEGAGKAPPPVDQADVDWWKQLMATAVTRARGHHCGNYAIIADPKTRQVVGEATSGTDTHPLHHPIMLAVHRTAVNEAEAWRQQGAFFLHKGRSDRGTASTASTDAPATESTATPNSTPTPQPHPPLPSPTPQHPQPPTSTTTLPSSTTPQPAASPSSPKSNSAPVPFSSNHHHHHHSPPTCALDPKRPKLAPTDPSSSSQPAASSGPGADGAMDTHAAAGTGTGTGGAGGSRTDTPSSAPLSNGSLQDVQTRPPAAAAGAAAAGGAACVARATTAAEVAGGGAGEAAAAAAARPAGASGAAAEAAVGPAGEAGAVGPAGPAGAPVAGAPGVAEVAGAGAAGTPGGAEAAGAGADPRARQYLCTGFDCIVVQEPCSMCAMGLVHSRIQRVVWCLPDERHGVLGSRLRLHEIKSLNHNYYVYRLPLAGS